MFKFLSHFEFIFVYHVRLYSSVIDLHDIKHYITHYEVTTRRELLDIETEPFTNYLIMKYDSMESVTKKKIKKISEIPNRILDQNYKLYRTDSSTRFTVLMDLCTCSG